MSRGAVWQTKSWDQDPWTESKVRAIMRKEDINPGFVFWSTSQQDSEPMMVQTDMWCPTRGEAIGSNLCSTDWVLLLKVPPPQVKSNL